MLVSQDGAELLFYTGGVPVRARDVNRSYGERIWDIEDYPRPNPGDRKEYFSAKSRANYKGPTLFHHPLFPDQHFLHVGKIPNHISYSGYRELVRILKPVFAEGDPRAREYAGDEIIDPYEDGYLVPVPEIETFEP